MNKYILTYNIFESDEFRDPIYRDFKNKPDLQSKLLELDKKKFNELYSKHKWYLINKNKKYFKNNLFTLINIAYDHLGGHVKINEPNKVENDDINFWTASDINDDPYADIVVFGKKTKYGIKISGFGHNSVSDSKKELFRYLTKLLNTNGYFLEASDKPAQIFLNRNIPIIHDINIIKEIFGNIANDAKYIDNDNIWYIRSVNDSGDKSKEILFGKPII